MTATSPRAVPDTATTSSRSTYGLAIFRRLLKPSLFDCILILLALMCLTISSSHLINSDGDMPRHLRVGEQIIESRSLPQTDVLSFTKFGEEFLAFEWGSEVLFALAYAGAGLPGVTLLTGLIVGLTFGMVVVLLERSRVHPLVIIPAVFIAIPVSMIHWLPRPHMFSALGAIVVLTILERSDSKRPWIMLPVFAIWANLHGAFLWGLTLIGLYAAGSLLELVVSGGGQEWIRKTICRIQMLMFALLGSLLTPFGMELHKHVIGYLNEDFILSVTGDFVSPNFQKVGPQIFLASLLVIVAGMAIARYRPSFPHLLVILATTAFSLHAVRNIPFYAVTAIPVFAIYFNPAVQGWLRSRGNDSERQEDRRVMPGLWSIIGVAGLILVAIHGAGSPAITSEFSNDTFPVDAVAYAREQQLQGHMFNEFLWGGYIVHAWPEQRVYIDAQTAFYGEELTREYGRLISLAAGWRETLDARDIDMVIMPINWPIVLELEREPGWDVWYQDDIATILVRSE